ncbi:MAG: 3TM-type holin [Leptothrix sp. (in: b-proteobacteria)]
MIPVALGGIISAVGQVADDLFTSDEERGAQAIELRKLDLEEAKLAEANNLEQLKVNTEEAKSSSLFVAGWRPAIGWVCAAACAWNWVGVSLAKVVGDAAGYPLTIAPLDTGEMMPVLLGMLGMGALRTFEKSKNVAR